VPWLWRLAAGLSTAETGIRTQVSPICGGQSGSETGFFSITSVFSCQYHSTDDLFSFISTSCSYQKDKWENPGNLPKSNALWEIGENLIEMYFQFFLFFKGYCELISIYRQLKIVFF
jgi:hypothetical protein